MHAFLQSFTLLLLIGLVGCGTGGNTKATLEVSRGFVISSSSFGGGLIITGKNLTTGYFFSQGLTGTRELNIQLSKGKWIFSAVAWDGGEANTAFSGSPYCGRVEQEFLRAIETVDLTVTKEKCNDPYFSAGHVETVSAVETFKKINIINTCNTFFTGSVSANSTVSSSLVNASTTVTNFCSTLSDLDLRSDIKSMKISTINSLNSAAVGSQLTKCIDTSAGTVTTDIRLPYGQIPFRVEIFESTGCEDQVASFPFIHGIAAGDSSHFDHLFVTNASGMRLVLPANKLGRAMSPFQYLMPLITKTDLTLRFPVVPSTLSGYDFRAVVGENKVIIHDIVQCPTGAITVTGQVQNPSCTDLGNDIEIKFNASAGGNGTFQFNSVSYSVVIETTGVALGRFATQQKVLGLLGTDQGSLYSKFYGIYNEDSEEYGALSVVRKMFRADGAGGVIGFQDLSVTFNQACLSAATDKTITLFNYDKMAQESYRVILSNNTVDGPEPFICDSTNINSPTCPTASAVLKVFDKKMIVYDHKISALEPIYVMKFNCSELVGKIETNSVRPLIGAKEEIKKILHWNTSLVAAYLQRLEEISWIKRYNLINGQYTKVFETRDITRFITTATSNFEIWNVNYSSKENTSNIPVDYDEQLTRTRIRTTSTTQLNYHLSSIGVTNDFESIFIVNGGTSSFLGDLPEILASSFDYTLTNAYPQSVTTGEAFTTFISRFGSSTQKINENAAITMTPQALNTTAFKTSFGGTFYTNP